MKLAILMYHKIDEPPAGVRNPGNFVNARRFEEQMDALLEWGYRTISFEQWLDYRNGVAITLPPRPLILTFDDGYTCFDEHAWPILRKRDMSATVFPVTSQIGGANVWDEGEVRLPLLTADRIRALQGEGVSFGSHTVSHRALARIPADDAFRELAESRWTLGELLGREVDVVAYPFSNQSSGVRALARQAGYRCAVRGKGRMNTRQNDPFGLRRIKVEPDTTVSGLRWTLTRERYLRPL
ncbi:MAG: polysaccharide deacetylase family protein [Gemmatimonadaceae bacterium]